MKLYDLSVETKLHDNGSNWILILEGPESEIELTFNGLYNWGAAQNKDGNGPDYIDEEKSIARVWTNKKRMWKFFYYLHFNRWQIDKYAKIHANRMIDELLETKGQFFNLSIKQNNPDCYSTGSIIAERPDYDFKDFVLTQAFKDKEHKKLDLAVNLA